MKRIITIFLISIICTTTGSLHAATLQPDLMKQMSRQETINKKNTIYSKNAERARIKKEKADKLAQINYQRILKKNNAPLGNTTTTNALVSNIQPSGNATLVIPHPPKIQPLPPIVYNTNASAPKNVDMNRVRSTWLNWYNTIRSSKGLSPYSYDAKLDNTAHDWNIVFAGSRGTIYHERSPGDGYYNFSVIDKWFRDRGVNPPIINRIKHSENVSYAGYRCNKSDCTDDLITALQSSYNFFVNSPSHYPSIVQPNFTKIGIDVIVDSSDNRSYITVHYMTE